jgi:tRNA nucleotidyltransferase/poly(A) polymerase
MNFVDAIIQKGGEIYLVGGTNRDRFFNIIHNHNKISSDYDILVRLLSIDELMCILSQYGTIKEVGKSFGIIIFKTAINSLSGNDSFEFDVALPRREVSTGTGYRDFEIIADPSIPIEVDLQRRDATINAIAVRVYSIDDIFNLQVYQLQGTDSGGRDSSDRDLSDRKSSGRESIRHESIIDPFNGINDIYGKLWNAVGDPYHRFLEDPTRIMRALRQCSELGLELEENTKSAIIHHSDLLRLIDSDSSVRITDELIRMLKGSHCAKHIDFILNKSKIGDELLLTSETDRSNSGCVRIYETMQMAVDQNLSIEERLMLLLITYKTDIPRWIKKFNLSAAPNFPKDRIPFLLYDVYNISNLINLDFNLRDNVVKLRWFIVNNKSVKNVLALFRVFYIINSSNNIRSLSEMNELILKHSNVILSQNDLDMNGNDLQNLFNLKGKQIGDMKKLVFEKVVDMEISNTFDDIKTFINKYLY